MVKKKGSPENSQIEKPENLEKPEQLEEQPGEQLEELPLPAFALTMAVEARIFSLLTPLFPFLERIEAGEKITEKEIIDKLSSVKVGKKTALEKLTHLRKQHIRHFMILELLPGMIIDPPLK
jgi:hypothetical protein